MKCLRIDAGKLSVSALEPVSLGVGEVRLEVNCAGICGTDMMLQRGYYDFSGVPGHEFVGRVVEAADANLLGKRFTADINLGCGDCDLCKQGQHRHCLTRQVVGIKQRQGAFATELVLPQAQLVVIPDALSDAMAVLVEPLAAALQILEQVDISQFNRVLIVGAGRLASLISHVVAESDYAGRIDVCIRSPERDRNFNFCQVIRPDVIAQDYDCVIEASGAAAGFALAMQALKSQGSLILKSTYPERLDADMSRVVVDEITIIGSRCGPMEKAVEWLVKFQGRFDNYHFVAFQLEDYQAAFEQASNPLVDKVFFSSQNHRGLKS